MAFTLFHILGAGCCFSVSPNYPKMDGTEPWNKPPCTGTGYTGSENHLVPEYTYGRGQEISDGAIYKVDCTGKETLVAFWNHGRFEKTE